MLCKSPQRILARLLLHPPRPRASHIAGTVESGLLQLMQLIRPWWHLALGTELPICLAVIKLVLWIRPEDVGACGR